MRKPSPSWSTANPSPTTTSSSAASWTSCRPTKHRPGKQVIDELIDRKGEDQGSERNSASTPPLPMSIVSSPQMSSRMRITPDQLTKSLESQGIRPDTLKDRIKAEMVWTSLVRGRFKESLQVGEKEVAAAVQVSRRRREGREAEPKLRIQDAADRPDRAARIRPRPPSRQAKGGRSPAQPRADLRRGQRFLQVHAKCRDTRDRDQDLGRHPGRSSRSARQDPDRPFDRRPK